MRETSGCSGGTWVGTGIQGLAAPMARVQGPLGREEQGTCVRLSLLLMPTSGCLNYTHPGQGRGLPSGSVVEPACQLRSRKLDPWVRKIPWRRTW